MESTLELETLINKITQGDCMQLMKQMHDDSVEMTLTDIPYGVVSRESNGLRELDKKQADVETFPLESFLTELVRVSKGSIYVFCSTEQISFVRSHLIGLGLTTRLCILEKTNPSPLNGQYMWLSGVECCIFGRKKGAVFNEFCKNTVWRYPCVQKAKHPTQKPLALFEYLIKTSSNPGDLIFDPCSGSATTALAAKKNDRRFIAFELDQEFVDVGRSRLCLTGSNQNQ